MLETFNPLFILQYVFSSAAFSDANIKIWSFRLKLKTSSDITSNHTTSPPENLLWNQPTFLCLAWILGYLFSPLAPSQTHNPRFKASRGMTGNNQLKMLYYKDSACKPGSLLIKANQQALCTLVQPTCMHIWENTSQRQMIQRITSQLPYAEELESNLIRPCQRPNDPNQLHHCSRVRLLVHLLFISLFYCLTADIQQAFTLLGRRKHGTLDIWHKTASDHTETKSLLI